ncbi:transglycosylase SLT domain-containing protein [Alcaligenaceae bacterium CGII-47]|nr:transglycosylase SLT domain-containing protein [Alcaligenaceae bacterium CGII-47]
MHLARSGEWLQRCVRSAVHPLGEFIHISAIYIGIAVLTTLALSLVLPSMRQQSRQLHEVMLTMFQADGRGYSSADDSDTSADWSLLPELPPQSPLAVVPLDQSAAIADAQTPPDTLDATGLNFMNELKAAMRGDPIPELTAAQEKSLRSYLSRKYKIAHSVAGALVRAAFIIGKDQGLDPQLLLAVTAIESRYNPFAESSVGAQGLMQVMSSVHRDKLSAVGGGPAAVFNPVVNMQVGAQILTDCIKRRGSVAGGLACYVGASGPGDGGYGARVLAERRRIALASGLPVGKP